MRRILSRLRALLTSSRLDMEFDEEIAGHMDLATADNIAKGMSPEEARVQARRAFGSIARTREAYREQRDFAFFDRIRQDVRYAVRGLRRTPAFTISTIAVLALAIGANSALFSVVDALLLRPLPYGAGDRIVVIETKKQYTPGSSPLPATFSVDEFDTLSTTLKTVDALIGFSPSVVQLATRGASDVVPSAVVSPNFFSALRGPMAAGRGFNPSDGVNPVAVVSERLAKRLVGEPIAAVIGKPITINEHALTVVGVAAPGWTIPTATTDVWMPTGYSQQVGNGRCCSLQLLAVLKSTSIVTSRNELEQAAKALAANSPRAFRDLQIAIVPIREQLLGDTRTALLVLWAAVTVILLLACANVLNLLLVRNAARARDTAIRTSLGASRGRLIQQGLAEAAVITTCGGGLGLLFANLMLAAYLGVAPESLLEVTTVHVGGRVLAFATLVAIVTTLLMGLLPYVDAGNTVSSIRMTKSPTREHRRLNRVLSTLQLAGAFVLVVAAILFGRSLVGLLRTDLGVTTDHVWTASLNLAFGRRHTDAEAQATYERIVNRIGRLPGVTAVGFGTGLPPNASRFALMLRRTSSDSGSVANAILSTPGYMSALGIRLLRGRLFTDGDDGTHPPVILVSSSTATRLFDDRDPIGQTVMAPVTQNGRRTDIPMTIVGVVGDVKYAGIGAPSGDQVYRPFAQQPWTSGFLIVRSARDSDEIGVEIRGAVAEVTPTVSASAIRPLDAVVAAAVLSPRLRAFLIISFAALGLAIATFGLYGVIAYSVSQRIQELGIRIALGAAARDVRALILREAVAIAVAGLALGLPSAYAASRAFATLLYGIRGIGVLSYGVAAVTLMSVAVAAGFIPASRATRVDPLAVLRAD